MHTQDFRDYINNIRKEALEIGYSITTMDKYLSIWNKFINWKNETHFIYDEKDVNVNMKCHKNVIIKMS